MNREQAEEILTRSGYEASAGHKGLTVGDRVRHISERSPSAHYRGTGTLEGIYHYPGQSWALALVRGDAGTYALVPDYHVAPAEGSIS